MTRFFGWMGFFPHADVHNAPPAAVRSALAGISNAATRTEADNFIAIAEKTADHPAECATVDSVSVALIGRPRLLDGAGAGARAPSAATLATAFKDRGYALLDQLAGAFAVAFVDRAARRGVVSTDRMGIQPLFFLPLEHGLAFAASPRDLAALAPEAHRLSPQALFDYLYCHVVPAPRSVYEAPRRLLPGECVEVEPGATRSRKYWVPRFDEQRRESFGTLQQNFLAALRGGVQDAMQGAKCGAFLSGGTDSSTIAGLMTELAGSPAETFSIGFEAAGYDEMEYARLASKHFGTRHHEYYVTPADIVDALPRLAAVHPQPFGNSSALPTFFCARLAREHGIERMLGGDGGDELFGGNARYAKQRVFAVYDALPAALRTGAIEPLCRGGGGALRNVGLGKLVSYVEQASVPMPDRLETYNLLTRIGPANVLEPEVMAAVDVAEPARLNADAYFNPSANSLINRMLALDFKTTLADNDLPKVVQSCALAGLPVAFPMLDHRVVDFSLSLAPELKLKGTRLRYFFKEALRGFLPPEIIEKKKHGFGLPFGEWAVNDPGLRALTYDTLHNLKARRLVRAQFIDELRDRLLPEYPNYYGTMAWILMTLELWLRANHDHP